MIPKIIHYCWVGKNPKPQAVLYCIESWKKFCPDYEIREWNESNYDFSKNLYMKQAYEAGKWGFVPDYARLDIIYQYGGIYLDTDVEIVKGFDALLDQAAFMGFENTGDGEFFVNCGHGFGAEAHNEVIRQVRDFYNHISFLNEDGTPNLLASPYFTTQSLRKIGLKQENRDQQLSGIMVYASDVLCPKNFRTGKVKMTSRTVSIHHFTASWVDERIKAEMLHQQKIQKLFGKKFGQYVLYIESVFKKYSPIEMFTKVPVRAIKKIKIKLIAIKDAVPYYQSLITARKVSPGKAAPVLLDTFMASDNCGDGIIMENCMLQLSDCIDVANLRHVPTHRYPTDEEKKWLDTARIKILCGTNILSGHMRNYGLWKLKPDISIYRETLLMGVGFDSKNELFDNYTKQFFHAILSKQGIHSVRDSFSERMLKSMGITNVLNTGCPTMWGLTPEHCATIPTEKATNVICTLTDYCRDKINDKAMLDILIDNYERVYLWLQGKEDYNYVCELGYEGRVNFISSTLKDYDHILEETDLDYVGTRLHAGIRALDKGHRSLIVSIDNRAECISMDTGLPIIKREDVMLCLTDRLNNSIETKITLPWRNIQIFKKQFGDSDHEIQKTN